MCILKNKFKLHSSNVNFEFEKKNYELCNPIFLKIIMNYIIHTLILLI